MSGSGWETLRDVREWAGGRPKCPSMVVMHSRMSGSCQKALSKSLRPSRMSGYGRDTFPDVAEWWEALPDVRQFSGGPPGCPEVAGRPSRLFGSG